MLTVLPNFEGLSLESRRLVFVVLDTVLFYNANYKTDRNQTSLALLTRLHRITGTIHLYYNLVIICNTLSSNTHTVVAKTSQLSKHVSTVLHDTN